MSQYMYMDITEPNIFQNNNSFIEETKEVIKNIEKSTTKQPMGQLTEEILQTLMSVSNQQLAAPVGKLFELFNEGIMQFQGTRQPSDITQPLDQLLLKYRSLQNMDIGLEHLKIYQHVYNKKIDNKQEHTVRIFYEMTPNMENQLVMIDQETVVLERFVTLKSFNAQAALTIRDTYTLGTRGSLLNNSSNEFMLMMLDKITISNDEAERVLENTKILSTSNKATLSIQGIICSGIRALCIDESDEVGYAINIGFNWGFYVSTFTDEYGKNQEDRLLKFQRNLQGNTLLTSKQVFNHEDGKCYNIDQEIQIQSLKPVTQYCQQELLKNKFEYTPDKSDINSLQCMIYNIFSNEFDSYTGRKDAKLICKNDQILIENSVRVAVQNFVTATQFGKQTKNEYIRSLKDTVNDFDTRKVEKCILTKFKESITGSIGQLKSIAIINDVVRKNNNTTKLSKTRFNKNINGLESYQQPKILKEDTPLEFNSNMLMFQTEGRVDTIGQLKSNYNIHNRLYNQTQIWDVEQDGQKQIKYQYDNNVYNTTTALLARQCSTMLVVDQQIHEEWLNFSKNYFKQIPAHKIGSFQDYIDHVPDNNKKLKYAAGFKKAHETGIRATYEAMTKKELYTVENRLGEQKPRVIFSPDDTIVGVCGYLNYNLLESLRSYNFISLSKNCEELQHQFNLGFNYFLINDGSNHDGHQNIDIKMLDNYYIEQYARNYRHLMEPMPNYVWDQMLVACLKINNNAIIRDKKTRRGIIKMKILGTVFSGHPVATTFGNSLRVSSFILYSAWKIGLIYMKDYEFKVSGDDQVIAFRDAETRRIFADEYAKIYFDITKYAEIMKQAKEANVYLAYGLGQATKGFEFMDYKYKFLSKKFYFQNGRYWITRLPERILFKGNTSNKTITEGDFRIAQVLGLSSQTKYSQFCQQFLKEQGINLTEKNLRIYQKYFDRRKIAAYTIDTYENLDHMINQDYQNLYQQNTGNKTLEIHYFNKPICGEETYMEKTKLKKMTKIHKNQKHQNKNKKEKPKMKAAPHKAHVKNEAFWEKAGKTVGGLVGLGKTGLKIGKFMGPILKKVTGIGDYKINSNQIVRNKLVSGNAPLTFQNNQTTMINHREYIQDLISGDANSFDYQTWQLNPGNHKLFPWLSLIAQNYESYRVHGFVFEFKSTSANALNSTNTALGQVIISSQYDAGNNPFDNKVAQEQYEFTISSRPSESIFYGVECKRQANVLDKYYVNNASLANNIPIQFVDMAQIQVSTNGIQAANINLGELWVTYMIELIHPKLGSEDSAKGYSMYIVNPTDLFTGNVIEAKGNNIGVEILNGAKIRIRSTPGNYLITAEFTAIGGMPSSFTIAGGHTINWFEGETQYKYEDGQCIALAMRMTQDTVDVTFVGSFGVATKTILTITQIPNINNQEVALKLTQSDLEKRIEDRVNVMLEKLNNNKQERQTSQSHSFRK